MALIDYHVLFPVDVDKKHPLGKPFSPMSHRAGPVMGLAQWGVNPSMRMY